MITVAGVPEYFTIPLEETTKELDHFTWRFVPQGTGEMVRLLNTGEIQIAAMLTEGSVLAKRAGAPITILHTYVESPLKWGIYESAKVKTSGKISLSDFPILISRKGSGSHIMALHLAQKLGIQSQLLEFITVGTLDGAVEWYERNRVQAYFFWENLSTQFLVSSGIFNQLSIHSAPWPSFVLVSTNDLLPHIDAQYASFIELLKEKIKVYTNDRYLLFQKIVKKYPLSEQIAFQGATQLKWSESLIYDSSWEEEIVKLSDIAGLTF